MKWMFTDGHRRLPVEGMIVVLALATRLAGTAEACGAYIQQNLFSDVPHLARRTDSNVVNAWGIAITPNGRIWVADNGTGVSTVYSLKGKSVPLVVTIPTAAVAGIAFNPSPDFVVASGSASGPSLFIFTTEPGGIAGWNPNVNRTAAILAVNNAGSEAIYKGLAIGRNPTGQFLYVTDFRNGRIDVFDSHFAPATLAGSFVDPDIRAGFAPFGISNIGGQLFVTYALQDEDKEDDVAGPGNGFVNVFDTDGNPVRRFASQGTLNSPWGLALAPSCFGKFSGDLLVGNFGDGHISAFDPGTGDFVGQVTDQHGDPVEIDGLWSLTFSDQAWQPCGPKDKLIFTAGPEDENHGLFGFLRAIGR